MRDLPHFPRVKIKLSMCSGLLPTHKSSAHYLQDNLDISCLRNGRAEVLCVQENLKAKCCVSAAKKLG